MGSPIFAKVTVLHKNGFRTDYTHVTFLNVLYKNGDISQPFLQVHGESLDSLNMPHEVIDKLLIKDLQMTIIDWYIP